MRVLKGQKMELVLPLKREFFDAIKAGKKTEEFRLRNDYWRKRLEGKTFDRVVLTLGYPKRDDTERRIVLPWQGYRECQITHPLFGDGPVDVFAINVQTSAEDFFNVEQAKSGGMPYGTYGGY